MLTRASGRASQATVHAPERSRWKVRRCSRQEDAGLFDGRVSFLIDRHGQIRFLFASALNATRTYAALWKPPPCSTLLKLTATRRARRSTAPADLPLAIGTVRIVAVQNAVSLVRMRTVAGDSDTHPVKPSRSNCSPE